jgi:putative copper export protein
MPPAVTYLLLGLCLAALLFGMWLSGKDEPAWAARFARFSGAFQIGALVAAYLVVRPGAGDDGLQAIAEAQAQERPIFVDLYSNF